MKELVDYIKEYNYAVPEYFCNHLISKFEQNEEQHIPGAVLQYNGQPVIDRNHKITTEIKLDESWDSEISTILTVAGKLTKQYADEFPWFDALYKTNKFGVEPIRIKRYLPGEFFGWHIDQNGGRSNRILAIQVYLNCCSSGTTEFNGKLIQPVTGKALVFPTNFLFPHRGNELIDENKYIFTLFITQ